MSDDLGDDVVDGIRDRDPAALAACYTALADPLFRYLLARSGDRQLAEDLVEATFLELVEASPRLSGGVSGVRAWLFRAARNNLYDEQRKARRRGDQPWEARVERADGALGPEDLALAADRDAAVRRALTLLSTEQREVLVLRYASGLTAPEIAEATGKTVGAVKALQHRGLASLRRLLGSHPDAESGAVEDPTAARTRWTVT